MLRIYFLQQWYALADEALEDALYDSQAMRNFVGIDLGVESVPDATTLLKFRDLLEAHDLGRPILEEIAALLGEIKLLMREGTLIESSIIAAPSSTTNARRERDPAMHQTRKGNQWYFGMRAHIGADEASGLVHSVEGTAANGSDISQAHTLLHGEEERAGGDAGYTGVEKREEIMAMGREIDWQIAARRSTAKKEAEGFGKMIDTAWETLKARARAVVEHPLTAPSGAALRAACGRLSRSAWLRIIKNISGTAKCATAGWRKAPVNYESSSPWPISTWCVANWWPPPQPETGGPPRIPGLNDHAKPKTCQKPVLLHREMIKPPKKTLATSPLPKRRFIQRFLRPAGGVPVQAPQIRISRFLFQTKPLSSQFLPIIHPQARAAP